MRIPREARGLYFTSLRTGGLGAAAFAIPPSVSDFPDIQHAASYLIAWHVKGVARDDKDEKDWHLDQKPDESEVMAARFKQYGFSDFVG